MHIRWRFRSRHKFKQRDTFKAFDPGVGCPGRKGPKIIVGKQAWRKARKALRISKEPVLKTDTGSQEENSKANGRRVVKELGKLTP